ncbi:cupin domain-containing protein [Patescibacteria group bacterium]|nr:cupin domain-containing protein [Patescibacteria group bacterium]
MDSGRIIAALTKGFPGKRIIKNPAANPTEILCETEPAAEHPEYSVVIGYLDRSAPHIHRKTTERYTAEKGEMDVYLGGKRRHLGPRESVTIRPGIVHWASGKGTRFRCESRPGWTPEDHLAVFSGQGSRGRRGDGRDRRLLLPDAATMVLRPPASRER